MKTYSVTLRYNHRRFGPSGETMRVSASSVTSAIAKAARDFVKTLDRRQRFDAGKGMEVKAVLLGQTIHPNLKHASPEVYAAVDKLIEGAK